MAHMYMLRCRDDSYYVGSTVQLEVRIAQHQAGLGAEYTKRRLPVVLVFAQHFDRIEDAYAMEKRVQNWSRAKREALIRGAFDELPGLSKKRRARHDFLLPRHGDPPVE